MKLGEQLLPVSLIDDRESIQSRAEVSRETVSDYSRSMQEGERFPAIVVFFDGKIYRIADGVHRYSAVLDHNGSEILAEVRQGGRLDAILHAVGANRKHGLRFTNKDKAHAVKQLVAERDVSDWSDRDIAKACGVSHTFVATLRHPAPGPAVASVATSVRAVGCEPKPSVVIPSAPPAPTPSAVAAQTEAHLREAAQLETHAGHFLQALETTSPPARAMARAVLDDVARKLSQVLRESAA